MNIKSTQLSLPLHDVAKTQALRERLEANQAAKQDLVDIMTLPKDQAELRSSAREDARMSDRLNPESERKLTHRLLTGSAVGVASTVIAAATGYEGLAIGLGFASGFSAIGAMAVSATALDSHNASWQAEASKERKELLAEVQSDPQLVEHLSKKKDWIEANRAPDQAPPEESTPKTGVLADVKGGLNVALRAPHILTTPLANALSTPQNLAEESVNEQNGTGSLFIGTGAVLGAGVGLALTLSDPVLGPVGKTIFGIVGATLGTALGGMTGMITAQAALGVSKPLDVGRRTAAKLGDGHHSLWTKYKTGVGLAAQSAYDIGRS